MKKKISVILLEDVPSLGVSGDIVTVSEGYARNLLFPQGKAALATAQIVATAKTKEEQTKAVVTKQLAEEQARAQDLAGTELTITAKAKESAGEQIYGSITAAQIAKQFNVSSGLNLKAKDIVLPRPIIALGDYEVTVKLSADVETTIHIVVASEEEASDHADK